MAQYKVLVTSYINNRLCQPGEVIEFTGKPGSNLQKVEKKAAKAEKPAEAPAADEPAADADPVI